MLDMVVDFFSSSFLWLNRMFEKFTDLEDKISHLEGRLSDPQLVKDQKEYQKVVREHANLTKLNKKYLEYTKIQEEIEENRIMLHDEDEDQELKGTRQSGNRRAVDKRKKTRSGDEDNSSA